MELLYVGRYRARFFPVCRLIKGSKVTELCFGDTLIARYCQQKNIQWHGIDINANFVRHAEAKGYSATQQDIRRTDSFPVADTCIISGSLYHFHGELEELFGKMLAAAPYLIISEPVINLSSGKGLIGKLAKGSADIEGEEFSFRFTEEALLNEIKELSVKMNFRFTLREHFSKDLIFTIEK
jgi:hypothetical protein